MRVLLLEVRDGNKAEELSKYPQDVAGFHAALLVNEGFADGKAVRGHDGQYIGAAMDNLTSKGYDFLDALEAPPNSKIQQQTIALEIFISHSSEDADVAEALVELLQSAFRLSSEEIRCTNVSGFGFRVGANFDEQLKQETVQSGAFVGLITPNSIQSAYVLFELGARWGAGRTISPVFAKGADATFLMGPLHSINALDARVPADVHQLLHDLAEELGRALESAAVYQKHLTHFVEISSQTAKVGTPEEIKVSLQKLVPPIPKAIRDDVMGVLANQKSFRADDFASASGLSRMRAEYYLGELEKAGLVLHSPDEWDAINDGVKYEATQKGRKYIVENDLDRD